MRQTDRDERVKTFPHPVDSGWSWVVLAGGFATFVIFGGVFRSFGIFMVEFKSIYNADVTISSVILCTQMVVSSVTAFLSTTLVLKFFSPRQAIMTGGLTGSIGLMINFFAESIYFFIFSQGIFMGLSIGFILTPLSVSIISYFKKKRGLANGVMMSGVGVGGLIMGPLSRYLIDAFTLKGAFLIIGAIHLNVLVAGTVFRPLSFYQVTIKTKKRPALFDSKKPLDKNSGESNTTQPLNKENGATIVMNKDFPKTAIRTNSLRIALNNIEHRTHAFSESDKFLVEDGAVTSKSRINTDHQYLSYELLPVLSINNAYSEEVICHRSSHNLSSSDDSLDDDTNTCITTLKSIFDVEIFKNIPFTIYTISYLIGAIGCFHPVFFIPVLADFHGIDKTRQSLLISIISGLDTIGRAGSGVIADMFNRKYVIIISLTICGIMNCLNTFYTEFWSLALFSVVFGLFGSVIIAQNPPTIAELVPNEQFGQAVGFVTGTQQIIIGSFGPVIGVLRDVTGSFDASFYFLGLVNLFAVLLLTIDVIILQTRKRKAGSGQEKELSD